MDASSLHSLIFIGLVAVAFFDFLAFIPGFGSEEKEE
jgi:hypothetical protein